MLTRLKKLYSWLLDQEWRVVVLLVVLAFGLRMYRIGNPIGDWHGFRQADTASVTREYVKNGVDLLRPRYHDLGNIQSGLENLEGYRMVEFPFINAGIALLLQAVPALPLVGTSRIVSVLFSLGALVSLYYLVRALSGRAVAVLAALAFAVLPYSVYYARTVLPEPALLFFSLFSLLSFWYWLDHRSWKWYLTSLTSLALALLLKPFAAILGGVFASLIWYHSGWKGFLRWQIYPFAILSFLPFLWWRQWIEQFPSGIPAFKWLFNENMIRLRPAWFYWLFWRRLGLLITGGIGLGLLAANLGRWSKDMIVYGSWWAGVLAYFIVIATGNVQHDYYQVITLPIVCISVARGSVIIFDWLRRFKLSSAIATVVISGLWLAMLAISWQQTKGYFNINHWEYVHAGRRADELLPPDAVVIAPAMGDTIFLFETNRTGWPIGYYIEQKREAGATHYVTTSFDDEANELLKQYTTIEKTPQHLILDLTKPL